MAKNVLFEEDGGLFYGVSLNDCCTHVIREYAEIVGMTLKNFVPFF